MLSLVGSVDAFLTNVRNGTSVYVTEKGEWGKRCLISRIARKILGLFGRIDDSLEIAQQVSKYLSTSLIEIQKGAITASKTWEKSDRDRLINGVLATLQSKQQKEATIVQQMLDRKNHLEHVATTKNPSQTTPSTEIVDLCRTMRDYGRARHVAADLERARLSHEFLSVHSSVIANTPTKKEDILFVSQTLTDWQRNQFPFVDYRSKELSSTTMQKIIRACRFPQFIDAMRLNPTLSDQFFDAVFRNISPECIDAVDLFILCPSIQKELSRTFIDKCIQNIRTTSIPLRIEDVTTTSNEPPVRDVKLLIHNSLQSIVDPDSSITIADVSTQDIEAAKGDQQKLKALAERTQMSVRKLFKELDQKNEKFIDVEWVATGLEQINSLFPKLDLTRSDWWTKLPLFEKPLTRKEIEEKYNISFKTGHALFVLRASRKNPDLSASDTHAWADLLIPLGDDTFNLVALGKYSEVFPNTFWEKFAHIFRSHRATLSLIDPNKIMSSRERIAVPCPALDEQTFTKFMEKLRNDLLDFRKGLHVFQAQGDNCAAYTRDLIRFLYPHLGLEPFETQFQELSLPGLLMPIIHARKIFPTHNAWNIFRFLFCCIFGAWKTTYFPDGKGGSRPISLASYRRFREGICELPAKAFLTKPSIEQMIREATTPETTKQSTQPSIQVRAPEKTTPCSTNPRQKIASKKTPIGPRPSHQTKRHEDPLPWDTELPVMERHVTPEPILVT